MEEWRDRVSVSLCVRKVLSVECIFGVLFLMIRRPPSSPRTDTLFPYPTLVRSRPARWLLWQSTQACWLATEGAMVRKTALPPRSPRTSRSEEHRSELQSLMRISYAVVCCKKEKHLTHHQMTPSCYCHSEKNTTDKR